MENMQDMQETKMGAMRKTKVRTVARYAVAAAALASLAFMVNFIWASSGTAEFRPDALPKTLSPSRRSLVGKIVEHRDFFTRFNGYDGDLLCDVNSELGEGKIGLLLLEPVGFLKILAFDRSTLKKIYEDVSIPPKRVRTDLASDAVSVSDARFIAKNIAGLRKERGDTEKTSRRKNARRETPRREAMPQSLPEGFAPTEAPKKFDSKKALEQLRRDVENNFELNVMTSEEILERLRSDIQNSPRPRKAAGSR
jgi:hypothetical protein